MSHTTIIAIKEKYITRTCVLVSLKLNKIRSQNHSRTLRRIKQPRAQIYYLNQLGKTLKLLQILFLKILSTASQLRIITNL